MLFVYRMQGNSQKNGLVKIQRPREKGRRLTITILVLVLASTALVLVAPSVGRWYLTGYLLPRISKVFKRQIRVEKVKVRFGRVQLYEVTVRSLADATDTPMVRIPQVTVEYDLIPLLRGMVNVRLVKAFQPRVNLVSLKNGSTNFEDLISRKKQGTDKGRLTVRAIEVRDGVFEMEDQRRGGHLSAKSVFAYLVSGGDSKLSFAGVEVKVRRFGSTAFFSKVEVKGPLGREKGTKLPQLWVEGGQIQVFPSLLLSGIRGTVGQKKQGKRLFVDIMGSYAGAETKLWAASGWVEPFEKKGDIQIKAARFSLGRIAPYLKRTPVILPEKTTIDGWLGIKLNPKALTFEGELAVTDLNLFHPGLARTPVLDLSGVVSLSAQLELTNLAVAIEQFKVQFKGAQATLSGKIERLENEPLINLDLSIPEIPCQRVLDAIPLSLAPELQGFQLRGNFSADVHAHIDYEQLDKIELGGKVDLWACKVEQAPPQVNAERLQQAFEQVAEPEPGQLLSFVIGPENPDFTPFDEISPYVINAFLTTEDGNFFGHRGFIPSQFRTALARNLKRGGFRLGASTITMQMVKNVLLTHEKTLSRKLQELFLTWYLEQNLSKMRIMEIYLNAIEFGPGIYGVGKAAKHYFGKPASVISPLEAAFFATILPSPTRRYVQYCQGDVSPKWDNYVRRVLKRMFQRERLTEAEFETAKNERLVFVRDLQTLPVADCEESVENLINAWNEEQLRRLKASIIQAAPEKKELYLPQD
ncbi:MAG: transglycosylase domain-containing protein [Pseudomonadota bacterium]